MALWARLPGSGGGHAERLPARRRAPGLTPEASRTAGRDAVRQSAHRADHGAHRRECQVYHREYGPGVSRLRGAGGSGTPGPKPGRARGGVCWPPVPGPRLREAWGAGLAFRGCGALTPLGFHPSGWPILFGGSSSLRCP